MKNLSLKQKKVEENVGPRKKIEGKGDQDLDAPLG